MNIPTTHEGVAALFLQAAKENGLHGDDLNPWHMKVSYKLLDAAGRPGDHGTIEEFWAGPKMEKLVVTSTTEKLIYLQTEKGFYREGELNQKMALLELLARAFIDPMGFSDKSLTLLDITLQPRTVGSLQLRCFSLKIHAGLYKAIPGPEYDDPAFCLEGDSPILQMDSFADESHRFILYHTGRFQNRYVPMDITAIETDKADLTAHLDVMELISNVDPSEFIPGPDAVLQHTPETTRVVPEGMLDMMIETHHVRPIGRPQPEYPAAAKAANVHGTVRLRAMIGTDGHIAALHVIEGPDLLRQAALDAVWRWRFEEPFDDARRAQILTVIAVRF